MAVDRDGDWDGEWDGSEPIASLFAGRAVGLNPDEFRRSGRPVDRWIVAAKGFVEILDEWIKLDSDQHEYVMLGPDEEVIYEPPERIYWVSESSPLRFGGVTLETFREDTASLIGNMIIDPDIRAIDHRDLAGLVNLIEDAYLKAECGNQFYIDPIHLCLERAKLACMAIKVAADKRASTAGRPKAPFWEVTAVANPVPKKRITLDQAAALVNKTKRTLEHYRTKGLLPPPSVKGGGGRPNLWDWDVMRPWLAETFRAEIPELTEI